MTRAAEVLREAKALMRELSAETSRASPTRVTSSGATRERDAPGSEASDGLSISGGGGGGGETRWASIRGSYAVADLDPGGGGGVAGARKQLFFTSSHAAAAWGVGASASTSARVAAAAATTDPAADRERERTGIMRAASAAAAAAAAAAGGWTAASGTYAARHDREREIRSSVVGPRGESLRV